MLAAAERDRERELSEMRQYLSVLFLLTAIVALATATVTAEDWKDYITAEGEAEYNSNHIIHLEYCTLDITPSKAQYYSLAQCIFFETPLPPQLI